MIDNERIKKAVERYVGFRGWEVLDDESFIDNDVIIMYDTENHHVVIVKFGVSRDGFEVKPMSGEEYEDVMIQYISDPDAPLDVLIRHDIIDVHVAGKDRAIIRHHLNAYGTPETEV